MSENTRPQERTETSSREVVLTGQERRQLLERIEHSGVSPQASPQRILEQAEQALTVGRLAEADHLAAELERTTSHLLGLEHFKARLDEAKRRARNAANVKKAEEMLRGYLEQRKKPAAQMALEALSELAPDHPKLVEYGRWVDHLDREVALQSKLEAMLEAGLAALRTGDLASARHHLARLREIDDSAPATFELAGEVARAEAGEAESVDLDNLKRSFEEHLAQHRFQGADEILREIARHEVAKVTLDRLRRRLSDATAAHRRDQELAQLEERFARLLAEHRWQDARELAHQVGERFPNHPRSGEMWQEVSRGERRDQQEASVRQGLDSLEGFLAQSRSAEARLALKLIRGKVDAERFADYERRVQELDGAPS